MFVYLSINLKGELVEGCTCGVCVVGRGKGGSGPCV